MISWSTMAAETMYQAIAIGYLPASESSSNLDVQCHITKRNALRVNRLWAPYTIKFKLYKMESDIYRLLFGHSVESLGQSDQ